MTAELAGTGAPAEQYDVALLDLDGVVYIGAEPAPHAIDALAASKRLGMNATYITNNASRTPEEVVERLRGIGVPAEPTQIVTSAQATARLIVDKLSPGARVLVTGAPALRRAIEEVGLVPVTGADDRPDVVALGFDTTMDYPRFAEACLAIGRGALFVASNRDATIPTDRGPAPGMGSFAALVATATGTQPLVAGKPERALFAEALHRSGARNALVVGDRLDTDIEGARNAGLAVMLVMTGVTRLVDAVRAAPRCRPNLIAADLRGLTSPHPPALDGRCGDARAECDGATGEIVLTHRGDDDGDVLRAVVTAGWRAVDDGRPAGRVMPPADLTAIS